LVRCTDLDEVRKEASGCEAGQVRTETRRDLAWLRKRRRQCGWEPRERRKGLEGLGMGEILEDLIGQRKDFGFYPE
jgi:hypothetical protein